jgi:uncharacterized SAM-binding protein YcdF (DUF218 family)
LFREKRPRSQISSWKMKTLLGLAGLGALFLLFHEQWLRRLGDFLVVQDILHRADVIHVIAGEEYRTEYAIQLYHQGLGSTLFFTGGWCKIHLYHHGEHARELALASGVPADAIAVDDSDVTSTYIEAERLKEWIDQSPYPLRSVIIVSDPFHMQRARWTYEKVFGENLEVQMAPVPFDRTPYQRIWWKDAQSRQNVREEYTKFVYYVFRYQLSWGFVRDWLASLDTD